MEKIVKPKIQLYPVNKYINNSIMCRYNNFPKQKTIKILKTIKNTPKFRCIFLKHKIIFFLKLL